MANQVGDRAIVLIPGLKREERNQRRNVLARNFKAAAARTPVRDEFEIEVAGESGWAIVVEDHSQGRRVERRVDLFEAYWGDQVVDQTAETPLDRLWRGSTLIVYWLFSGVWGAVWVSRFMTFGLLLSGVLLMLWYFSVVAVAAIAIDKAPDIIDGSIIAGPIGDAVKGITKWIAALGDWKYWAMFVGILGALGADKIADIAVFSKAYLANEVNETETGLRERIGERVKGTLRNDYEAGYGEVIVLAHSFGTAIAIDVLADYPDERHLARTRLVTWGSPLAILSFRSRWLADECRLLLSRNALARWDDFHAPYDWLCSAVPGHEAANVGASVPLKIDAFWLEGITSRTHQHYYRTQHALEHVLSFAPPAPAGRSPDPHAGGAAPA